MSNAKTANLNYNLKCEFPINGRALETVEKRYQLAFILIKAKIPE